MNEKRPLSTLVIGDFTYETELTHKFEHRKRYVTVDPRKVICIIPGLILKLHVRVGDVVQPGDRLLVLEAMKMQNEILSPLAGTVKAIPAHEGGMVTKGEVLLELE